MYTSKKAWINGLFLLVTLAVNALGALGLINGLSQKEISDMYITLITPSPSTFSIWSVIYTLLIISLITMIIKKRNSYYNRAVNGITNLFRISCLLNIGWIVAFSFVQIELSVVFIFAFVIVLSLICKELLRIHEGRRWLLPLSFGLYTGWLFIATVVNISAALVKQEWNGFGIGDEIWASIILIIAALLVIGVQVNLRNAIFSLPVAWAYFGIYQFLRAPEGFNGQIPFLHIISLVGMVVLIGSALIQFFRNHFSILPKMNHY
ncbi:tryptophan-rich sensory protein [Tissierella creatinini]|nr:tryptophan-rich sensory protein [Tissierella creatinini]TJX66336.1 tryptophan-rich sensory protein [Soehngenia saccharolytica]